MQISAPPVTLLTQIQLMLWPAQDGPLAVYLKKKNPERQDRKPSPVFAAFSWCPSKNTAMGRMNSETTCRGHCTHRALFIQYLHIDSQPVSMQTVTPLDCCLQNEQIPANLAKHLSHCLTSSPAAAQWDYSWACTDFSPSHTERCWALFLAAIWSSQQEIFSPLSSGFISSLHAAHDATANKQNKIKSKIIQNVVTLICFQC